MLKVRTTVGAWLNRLPDISFLSKKVRTKSTLDDVLKILEGGISEVV